MFAEWVKYEHFSYEGYANLKLYHRTKISNPDVPEILLVFLFHPSGEKPRFLLLQSPSGLTAEISLRN